MHQNKLLFLHPIGLKSPNVFGQGEKFQIDYSHGTKKTSQFNVGLSKPLHDMKTQQVAPNVSLNAFQQIGELPWSAYKVWQNQFWNFFL